VGARSREERVEQLMVVVVVVATSELLGSSRATYGYRVGRHGGKSWAWKEEATHEE
jgi:hypothetical protein